MENQDEEDFINEEEIIKTVKAKRIPSPAQLKHLENIRGKALVKKQQMREVTEKATLAKELDDKKILKQKEKELMCQKYENHIKEKIKAEDIKKEEDKEKEKENDIIVDFENKKVNKVIAQKEVVKPKKKVIKKIIYEEEDSTTSEEDVKEIIVHRKSKSKPKKGPVGPVEAETIVPPPKELSYNEMIYETSLGRIKNRINDERARTILHSVIPNYY
jgi:unconventional prefoldin RPB5 interactor 1